MVLGRTRLLGDGVGGIVEVWLDVQLWATFWRWDVLRESLELEVGSGGAYRRGGHHRLDGLGMSGVESKIVRNDCHGRFYRVI